VEQRYQAVMAVLPGDPVVEVAARMGGSRPIVHTRLVRYAEGGLAGLQDRSRRPAPRGGGSTVWVERGALRGQAPAEGDVRRWSTPRVGWSRLRRGDRSW
jgi:hypothetical protein